MDTVALAKGGLTRRFFALAIDLFVAEVLIQLLAAVILPLSGGRVVDSSRLKAPRALKLPVCCSSSSFRVTGGLPVKGSVSTGVRRI